MENFHLSHEQPWATPFTPVLQPCPATHLLTGGYECAWRPVEAQLADLPAAAGLLLLVELDTPGRLQSWLVHHGVLKRERLVGLLVVGLVVIGLLGVGIAGRAWEGLHGVGMAGWAWKACMG